MTFKSILVAVDGSPQADAALDLAARLAAEQHAALTIATVVGRPGERYAPPDVIVDPEIDERIDEEANALLARSGDVAKGYGAQAKTCVRVGSVVDAILACIAETGADLVVVGTHGRSGISRAILGSVSEGVLRESTVPVLIAHARS
jgi:nucleotide-binding universal stress UspA family protein